MGERCVPNLIVINSTINQLEPKVSLITTRCLRLFVVVYRVEMHVVTSEVIVSETCVPSLIVICTAINQLQTKVSLKTI